ncbi:MAG: hypothetical protein BJ554DRAFT_2857 [Olpidium bornovanus]|uniref:Uncharacterized protein n=1 Tax=Olpidium bornovanus TaxID=278681 RepID=A0A8H8DGM5_9FUNG|nr:MAG: hypothetical protein BJ554DRAFT_2857 [Olpidium bornovanus]
MIVPVSSPGLIALCAAFRSIDVRVLQRVYAEVWQCEHLAVFHGSVRLPHAERGHRRFHILRPWR